MRTKPPKLIRRRNVILAAPAIFSAPSVMAAIATPPQPEGPFYPRAIPEDSDADLTRFGDRTLDGEVIEISGQVFDLKRRPIPGTTVEIWHCDQNGIYPHVGRNNGGLANPYFQGFGAVTTGPDGTYRFRTIRPGLYPGRVRHVHFKVRPNWLDTLTTQMYFPEEKGNAQDFLLNRAGNAQSKTALIAQRTDGPPDRYVFDIFVS
ncbi:MAG: protocatechuate 3,4-dioxygenase [Pseudomonadota bacterium]